MIGDLGFLSEVASDIDGLPRRGVVCRFHRIPTCESASEGDHPFGARDMDWQLVIVDDTTRLRAEPTGCRPRRDRSM